MIIKVPLRLTILHFGHIFLMLDLTFIFIETPYGLFFPAHYPTARKIVG